MKQAMMKIGVMGLMAVVLFGCDENGNHGAHVGPIATNAITLETKCGDVLLASSVAVAKLDSNGIPQNLADGTYTNGMCSYQVQGGALFNPSGFVSCNGSGVCGAARGTGSVVLNVACGYYFITSVSDASVKTEYSLVASKQGGIFPYALSDGSYNLIEQPGTHRCQMTISAQDVTSLTIQ